MKIGLHSACYLGLWYDGPGLAPLEFLRRARYLGFDGVEFDGRRPHASPLDLDQARRRAIRELCGELELDLVAVDARNDFSSLVLERREAQLLMVREHIRLARDLGAPVLRIYLAYPGVVVRDGLASAELGRRRYDAATREETWLEAWNACKACLREAVRYAEDDGVVLALQNQPPVARDHQDVLNMIAETDSPWLRACIDAPLLEHQDSQSVRQAVLEVGALQVHTHFGGEFLRYDDGHVDQRMNNRDRPPANYPAFVRALREAGYDGYLCLEMTQPALDERHELKGVEFVDDQALLAREYMQAVIDSYVQPSTGGDALASAPVA